jgi:hypothetical protein
MTERGELVGLLHVGRDDEREFSPAEHSLAMAIAAQAALAIQNGRLRSELAEQERLFGQALRVEDELSQVALEEEGVEGICRALERLSGRQVRFRDDVDPAAPEAVTIPVSAGGEELGVLDAGPDPLAAEDRLTLEYGASLVALELQKSRRELGVRQQVGGELLEALIGHQAPYEPHIETRARRLDFALDGECLMLVICGCGDVSGAKLAEVVAAPAGVDPSSILVRHVDGRWTLAVAAPRIDAQLLAERLRGLDPLMSAGLGIAADCAAAHDEALACQRLAGAAPRAGVLVDGRELGPLRFLLDAGGFEALVSMVGARLGPIREVQERGGAPLLETLESFLESGRHYGTAARQCGVHPSTLKYRVKRIREILDDPLEGEMAFQIWLSCRTMRLLEHLGYEPFAGDGDANKAVFAPA